MKTEEEKNGLVLGLEQHLSYSVPKKKWDTFFLQKWVEKSAYDARAEPAHSPKSQVFPTHVNKVVPNKLD